MNSIVPGVSLSIPPLTSDKPKIIGILSPPTVSIVYFIVYETLLFLPLPHTSETPFTEPPVASEGGILALYNLLLEALVIV